ncbi:hypothetical protein HOG16_00015 [Candidatus Woesearchaeota archaeon]|jgi:hypothetical protein|nr:hypothetical protein [Candidatus Woesearchaeota archaeon]MBT4321877.1 hypothetical protein [Candidatus Woesearchaeota archaeon]MBT4630937.1 hypothetical protein [Candidatus Woesearchaeota archaeon]
MGRKVVDKKKKHSKKIIVGKNKGGKLVNYILLILVSLGILNGVVSNYSASNYLFVILLLLGGFFIAYSLLKRLMWVYYFFLIVNVFVLIYRMVTIGFLFIFWAEGLWSVAIVLLSYWMLTEISPKKFQKLPWFR